MLIFGVDPGLQNTGFGLIKTNAKEPRLIKAGVIRTTAKQKIEFRLEKIYVTLGQLLDENKPDVVVLEKLYAHYKHPITVYLLGQARGVVCLLCAQRKIPLVEYLPTRIKKAVIGRGDASKYQIQCMVSTILGIKNLNNKYDVTDALSLAIGHEFILRCKV